MSHYTAAIETSPSREIHGLVSHVLLQRGEPGKSALTATWVEVSPGASHRPHHHPPEQIYVVVAGRGRMRIDDEERRLGPGQLALVPSGATHGIANTGGERLVYISAATQEFRVTELYDSGSLR